MKVIAIWDIHGRDCRKEIIEQPFDKCIFMWDYFDSYDISIEDQIQNFNEILKFKRNNKYKVTLLIWNHDFHYTSFTEDRYSWFNSTLKLQISNLISNLIEDEILEIAYEYNNISFSHAWFSNTWYKWLDTQEDWDMKILEFNREDCSWNWNSILQWPIWIRPEALITDMLEVGWIKYKQVVGHTRQENIIPWELTCIDCLENRQYLIIEDWVMRVWTF